MTDSHGHHDSGHGAPHEEHGGKLIQLPEPRLVAKYTSGGHEIDATPNKSLMTFLGVMSVLLVVVAIFVYQLFVGHAEGDLKRAADRPASQLTAQHDKERQLFESWGKVEVEGRVVGYRMPIADAKVLVLASPNRFAPAAPPAEWVHPDDAPK